MSASPQAALATIRGSQVPCQSHPLQPPGTGQVHLAQDDAMISWHKETCKTSIRACHRLIYTGCTAYLGP
eukprot:5194937-Amphidinium_carterae.1